MSPSLEVEKRFKVVQAASGTWGILDTVAVEFDAQVGAFAPYDFTEGAVHKWIDLIHEHAISLNARRMDRDDFHWVEYEEEVA